MIHETLVDLLAPTGDTPGLFAVMDGTFADGPGAGLRWQRRTALPRDQAPSTRCSEDDGVRPMRIPFIPPGPRSVDGLVRSRYRTWRGEDITAWTGVSGVGKHLRHRARS